jgi:hypothetical protein
VSLDEPRPALLAGDLAVEEALDDLTMGAENGAPGQLVEKRKRVGSLGVRRQLLSTFQLDALRLRERCDGVDAARVGTGDDLFDLVSRQ